MNKKLISALFVGALLLGSTSALTSCKDYDDDIDNLQTQIDKAALASDVAALKTELTSAEATATAAKTSADAAVASAKAANDAVALKAAQADLTAAVARITALETEMSKLTDFEAKLQATVDTEIASLKTEFATLKAEIEEMVGTMVTDVSVFASYLNVLNTSDKTFENVLEYNTDVDLEYNYHGYWASLDKVKATVLSNISYGYFSLLPTTGTQVDATFGSSPAADRTITYTKGASVNFPTTLVIRVNPTNYTPDKSDIKLVNSKGEDLSSVLEVTGVEKFDEVLTARGVGNGTGLWNVKFQLKDGKTADDLEALTWNDDKEVLFAVAVNNTSDDSRSVVSSYDVTAPEALSYLGSNSLSSILVNKTAIASIHNRYNSTEASTTVLNGGKSFTAWEHIWTGNAAATATVSNSTIGDNRQTQPLIMTTLGTQIPISFENLPAVQHYYVTLDTKNSVDSDNSEINAWNSYTYTGLNTIYSASEGSSISVTKMGKTEDIIGFRIYAVNFDGTLADPDGIAFYVYVGDQSNVGSAEGDFVPTKSTPNTTAAIAVSGTFLTGGDFAQTGSITFANGAAGTYALYKADGTTAATKWSEVSSAKITINTAATSWKDGTTSTAQIVGKKNGTPFNIVNVSLTKKLPTTFPSSFSWKASQLVDGLYTCYLTPTNGWTTAYAAGSTNITGFKALENVCNGLSTDGNYKIVIANAAYNSTDAAYTSDLTVTATGSYSYKLVVPTPLIDSSTAHQMKIYYTYNDISSESDDNDVNVLGQTVNINFACILNTSLEAYAWVPKANGTDPETYTDMNNVTYGATSTINAAYLKGTNSFDNTFTGLFSALDVNYPGGVTATLKSNETGIADYFTVGYASDTFTFTPLSSTTVPTANVPSTLTIKVVDAFGHTNTYSLPVTVKKP